jgi:hypothetical protein
MIFATSRPARIVSVLAGFLCFSIWYAYQPESILRCDLPIVVEQHFPTGDAGSAAPSPGAVAPAQGNPPPPPPPPTTFQPEVPVKPSANYSKIAKVTIATNALDNPNIHRALRTHETHNDLHGYKFFIGTHEAVTKHIEHDTKRRPTGAWTKPAYLLSIIVAELQKPEDERLEWIL